MATHKSAEKRARQNVKRADRNSSLRSRLRTVVRAFRESLAGDDMAAKEASLNAATRELRKAATKGLLHKRSASRHVSRLVLAFNANTAKA